MNPNFHRHLEVGGDEEKEEENSKIGIILILMVRLLKWSEVTEQSKYARQLVNTGEFTAQSANELKRAKTLILRPHTRTHNQLIDQSITRMNEKKRWEEIINV